MNALRKIIRESLEDDKTIDLQLWKIIILRLKRPSERVLEDVNRTYKAIDSINKNISLKNETNWEFVTDAERLRSDVAKLSNEIFMHRNVLNISPTNNFSFSKSNFIESSKFFKDKLYKPELDRCKTHLNKVILNSTIYFANKQR
jgi:hypothetical protein